MSTVIERQKEADDYNTADKVLDMWGRGSFWIVTQIINIGVGEDQHWRYRIKENRLSVSGESENPGDVAALNRTIGLFATIGTLLAMVCAHFVLLFANGLDPASAGMLATVGHLGLIASGTVIVGMACGTTITALGCELVDHTTEPLPDDVDELSEQFTNGDLDQHEFEAQLEDRLTEVDLSGTSESD